MLWRDFKGRGIGSNSATVDAVLPNDDFDQ
jgi:hypothetical protein